MIDGDGGLHEKTAPTVPAGGLPVLPAAPVLADLSPPAPTLHRSQLKLLYAWMMTVSSGPVHGWPANLSRLPSLLVLPDKVTNKYRINE